MLPTLLASLALSGPVLRPLTVEQCAQYEKDGVIVVRGLLRGRQLRAAQQAAEKIVSSRERRFSAYRLISFQGWRTNPVLRGIAFDSDAPAMAAQLMALERDQPLRLIKDAFLAYSAGDTGCGWHVDDKIFWPCIDSAPGTVDDGINVWITLSPIKASEGGGLAVAPGSHRSDWRERCRAVIAGSVGGGVGPPRTCDMAKLSPECERRLEECKLLHDMEPGDALLHSRYCFHRGEPFAVGEGKLRYSIRYMPAHARFFDNGREAAAGAVSTLEHGDPIAKAGAYYPQCWPRSRLRERWVIRLGRLKGDAGR